ncbi:MAG: putative rane protein [Clostridia bacterium]|jgi:uncharacterized membrane protein YdjX (TVP38/TMEM64 family)|nr:putative rane protein [Clostridia bacterium]
MNNKFVKLGLKLLLISVPFVLYFTIQPVHNVLSQVFNMLKTVDIQAIKSYILSFGIWAPVISYLIMLFQSLVAPLPSFVVTFVNAGLFGWWKGALLSWCGTLSGAVMCFWIARFYGREVVAKFTTKGALVRVDKFFDRYGKYAVLTARLLPFVSFDVISYGAGLTAMSFWSFFWATAIGQLPVTIVYSYVGGMLTGNTKTIVIGLLLMVSVGVLIFMLRKIWKDKTDSHIK